MTPVREVCLIGECGPMDGQGPTFIAIAPVPSSMTTIDPDRYSGKYVLKNRTTNENVGTFSGPLTRKLSPGVYDIDNNNAVGGSSFSFEVSTNGQVSAVSNVAAAIAVGNSLRFNTTQIRIVPGEYTGRYMLRSQGVFQSGVSQPYVITGLRDSIDNGTAVGTPQGDSYFYFSVAADGTVSDVSNRTAASADGNSVVFNNSRLTIDPNGYAGSYNVSAYANKESVSGIREFVMIPGLRYWFAAGNGSGIAYFSLDASGTPVNLTPAGFATASANKLTLSTIRVKVDPTSFKRTYEVGGIRLIGKQTIVLVTEMEAQLAVGAANSRFTPTRKKVTPKRIEITTGGVSHVFKLSVKRKCWSIEFWKDVF